MPDFSAIISSSLILIMNDLVAAIRNAPQKPALMTHVVAGFPGLRESSEIVNMMSENGADVIEIQIPFSDPVADGVTMQRCNELALEQGFHVNEAFETAYTLSQKLTQPLLFMTYYNIVFKRGVDVFCKDAKTAGVHGVIVPDMPFDEEHNEHFLQACRDYRLDWIPVVSPLTSEDRIQKLSEYAGGFWYVVSRTGVTGVRGDFSSSAEQTIQIIRKYSDLPVSLAFGVSKPEHLSKIGKIADMAVVGSAVQNIFLREEKLFGENLNDAAEFLKDLREY